MGFKEWLLHVSMDEKFRRMPASAQSLFFHLAAHSDNTGKTCDANDDIVCAAGHKEDPSKECPVDALESNGYISINYNSGEFTTRILPWQERG